MKTYYVSDGQWSEIIEAKSERQACIIFFEKIVGKRNPKLFKVFVDDKEGKTYHVGYGSGRNWLTVGEVSFLRREV